MKTALVALLLVAAVASPCLASELFVSFGADWALGSRGGIEYAIDSFIGVKVDLGLQIFGVIQADALGVFYLLPEAYPFRLNLLIGIPNAAMLLTFNAGMVSFGGCIQGGYWLSPFVCLDLRIGGGFPLFFEKDKDMIRDIHFPLNLWPDLVFSVTFRI